MSRRYGKVEKSIGTTLNQMLALHRDDVFSWIAERARLGDTEEEKQSLKAEELDLVMSLEKPDE
jgi:hypothetical protein